MFKKKGYQKTLSNRLMILNFCFYAIKRLIWRLKNIQIWFEINSLLFIIYSKTTQSVDCVCKLNISVKLA